VLQASGEQVVSIAGTWKFTPSGAAATTIAVPGGGWVAQGFSSNLAEAVYEQPITIPSLGSPQATLVEFGAVNNQATLSIDGTTVGTNMTSYTPSVFDISSAAAPNSQHTLTVDVKGRYKFLDSSGKKLVPDGTNWSPNIPQGIFRSAVLHVMPALHVSDAFVRTDVAADTLSVDVSVTNSSAAAATGTVAVTLSSFNCDAFSYPMLANQSVNVGAGQTATVTFGPVKWGLGTSSYWWPNIPYTPGYRARLHYASVSVTNSAGVAHTVPYRFGFRQMLQVADHYELNGVRVNLRGDNLQGVNYDSINITGKGLGDAYDLYAGFLPPSAGNTGWPGAVTNWQQLNYNGARIHQETAAPYMLDVTDEMGFMIIEETAIRGSANDENFSPAPGGEPNMLAHLKALILRDRNHPSTIRWSQCNEPENVTTNSATFQQDLYKTATAADDTRPISVDSIDFSAGGAGPTYSGIIANSNFAVMDHYTNGLSSYTDSVCASATKPCGVGEFIWSADNTVQGLTWFGTSTMAMRLKNASDLRPYTLLSGWASFVPGIKTSMMIIEPNTGTHPHFGEDNLPEPWSNPIIQRIQRGFNPVAVVDTAYWNANHLSNSNGDWPASPQTATKGSTLTRQLAVFNDTLSGTTITIAWEMHTDSATGATVDQGTQQLTIPLGQHTTASISVKAPTSGARGYLILTSIKDSQETFREDAEYFTLQ
jgi:hypothetical protein